MKLIKKIFQLLIIPTLVMVGFFIFTPNLYAAPKLNLTAYLQGLYNPSNGQSRAATDQYAILIELRNTEDGRAHSSF